MEMSIRNNGNYGTSNLCVLQREKKNVNKPLLFFEKSLGFFLAGS